MSWQDDSTTIIEGHGEVTADFDFAVFAVSIEGKGKTGRAAKESIQPKIEELLNVIRQFTESAKISKMISSFTTIPSIDYDRDRKPKTVYGTTFSLRFEVHNLLMVNEVHDAVTNLDVRAYSPMFMAFPAHYEAMKREAFKTAFQYALNQLHSQKHNAIDAIKVCSDCVRTFKSPILEIVGWEVLPENHDNAFNYSKSVPTLGGNGSSPELILEGKAKVSVSIRVGFKSI